MTSQYGNIFPFNISPQTHYACSLFSRFHTEHVKNAWACMVRVYVCVCLCWMLLDVSSASHWSLRTRAPCKQWAQWPPPLSDLEMFFAARNKVGKSHHLQPSTGVSPVTTVFLTVCWVASRQNRRSRPPTERRNSLFLLIFQPVGGN